MSSPKMGFSHIVIVGMYLCLTISAQAAAMPVLEPLQKFAVLVGIAVLIIRFGIRRGVFEVVGFYIVAVYVSTVFAVIDEGKHSIWRIIATTLSIGAPIVLAGVDLPERLRQRAVVALIYLPIVSVCLALPLTLNGYIPWHFEYTGAFRLKGGVASAHLSMLCLVSVFSSSVCYFYYSDNADRWVVSLVVAVLLLFATGTRGAMFVGVLGAVPVLRHWVVSALRARREVLLTAFFVMILIALLFAIMLVVQRNAQKLDSEAYNFSGRSAAWLFFYDRFLDSPVWGNGFGSVIYMTQGERQNNLSVFLVPHNEYLRFLVDLGLIGLIFLLFAYFKIYRLIRSSANASSHGLLLLFFLLFAVYAFVDNPISTHQFSVGWALLLAGWPRQSEAVLPIKRFK